jgi:hypothetical protein
MKKRIKNKLNNHMTTINKNPLEDKKWQKEFTEALKRDIKHSKSSQKKASSSGQISEIVCTQKDIGNPSYPYRKKKRK